MDFRKNNRHLYLNPPTEDEWENEILPWINGKVPRDIAKVLSKGNPTDWQWDYAKPEVREHFLSVIREACRRYDAADGVELDFLRYGTFFRKGEVSVDTMTDFVGEIHEILKAASTGRKEPLRLLVRVPETPEKALAIGLDVEQWMRRDWVDALIAGNGFIFSDDPVTPWRGITRAHGVELEVVWDGSDKSMAPKLSLNGVELAEFKERPTQHWPDMSDNPHSQEVPRDYRRRPDNRFTVALTDTELLRQTLKRRKNQLDVQAQEPSNLLSVSFRVVPSAK